MHHTQLFYGSLDYVRTTQVSWYQKKHSPTHIVVINHPLSASSICYHQWHPPCLIYMPHSLFSTIYLQVFFGLPLAWNTPLHILYVSSPNHCLLFAAHAHNIATCFVAVPSLCHLMPVSLSTLYLEFCLVVSRHTSI